MGVVDEVIHHSGGTLRERDIAGHEELVENSAKQLDDFAKQMGNFATQITVEWANNRLVSS